MGWGWVQVIGAVTTAHPWKSAGFCSLVRHWQQQPVITGLQSNTPDKILTVDSTLCYFLSWDFAITKCEICLFFSLVVQEGPLDVWDIFSLSVNHLRSHNHGSILPLFCFTKSVMAAVSELISIMFLNTFSQEGKSLSGLNNYMKCKL